MEIYFSKLSISIILEKNTNLPRKKKVELFVQSDNNTRDINKFKRMFRLKRNLA